jgi:Domain of unknown function (DUF3883)
MATKLNELQSSAAVQAALDEFDALGRTKFLEKYGFGKSREYLVRNARTGSTADSKAIVGAAYGFQYPEHGALIPEEFSGGDATIVPKLQSLGFEVVRIGEDWSQEEVNATVDAYFKMLQLEASETSYKKIDFNTELRSRLKGRTKGSVELKFQNISAVLNNIGLPFIDGYKPRGNSQLLLRKAVQKYVLDSKNSVAAVVDALEEVKALSEKTFRAVLVEPPPIEMVTMVESAQPRVRLPRKFDYAARDEQNRALGRAGEQWVLDYEQQRLDGEHLGQLYAQVEWVSDRQGDGAGFDILSFTAPSDPRYIEVKTTNGNYRSSFIISRNELDFSQEVGNSFYLYILSGDISQQLHLEALDYRASFRRLASP